MPYSRPTLTQLRQQALQDLVSVVGPLLPQSVLGALAWVQAKLANLHYGFLDWIARESTPITATDERLFGWAALKDVFLKDATPAGGPAVTFTGTPATPLPVGTALSRPDGFGYVCTSASSVDGTGAVTVAFQASTPGAAGNAAPGTQLVLSSPIAGIDANSGVIQAPGATGGADQETQDSLRTRMLQAYAAPPQGGDPADYIEWATQVPGVTRAWVAPSGAGYGTVVVFAMLDQAQAANGGFPQGTNGVAAGETRDVAATGDQLTLANALFLLRGATALVYACAPAAEPFAFGISGLGSANTAANQAAIDAALQDMFLRVGQVGGTIDTDTGLPWPAIDPSLWYDAIRSVLGTQQFVVTAPTAPITFSTGQLPVVGALTFAS